MSLPLVRRHHRDEQQQLLWRPALELLVQCRGLFSVKLLCHLSNCVIQAESNVMNCGDIMPTRHPIPYLSSLHYGIKDKHHLHEQYSLKQGRTIIT